MCKRGSSDTNFEFENEEGVYDWSDIINKYYPSM